MTQSELNELKTRVQEQLENNWVVEAKDIRQLLKIVKLTTPFYLKVIEAVDSYFVNGLSKSDSKPKGLIDKG